MRVVKPFTQTLLKRKFDYDKKSFFSVVTGVYFDFRTNKLCSEQELWKQFGDESLNIFNAEALDLCARKKSPELLVNGYAYGCYSVKGKTRVEVKLNNVIKSLNVWGDRYWVDGEATEPKPFDKIAISWKNAYGGIGYNKNPIGKGRDFIDIGDMRIKNLPNVESINEPIKNENKTYDPVGFSALPIEYPERNKLMGSYDEKWAREEFPSFAKNIDWSYFNQSPKDQRLNSLKSGDIAYFTNMHPQLETVKMTIPALKARAFLRLHKEKELVESFLHPVDLKLSTLWAFPHLERAFLLYEGVVEIERTYLAEDIISEIMIALEHEERPRELAYYEQVFNLRTDPSKSYHYALIDSQLVDEQFLSQSEKYSFFPMLKNKIKYLLSQLRELRDKFSQEYIDNLFTSDKLTEAELNLKQEYLELTNELKSIGKDFDDLESMEAILEDGFDVEEENKKMLEEIKNEPSCLQQLREQKKHLKDLERKEKELEQSAKDNNLDGSYEENGMSGDVSLTELSPEDFKRLEDALGKAGTEIGDMGITNSLTANELMLFMRDPSSFGINKSIDFKNLGDIGSNQLQNTFFDSKKHQNKIFEDLRDKANLVSAIQNKKKSLKTESLIIDSLVFFDTEQYKNNDLRYQYQIDKCYFNNDSYRNIICSNLTIKSTVFINCIFDSIEFYHVHFDKCTFKNCQMRQSTFENCHFEDTKFIDSDLRGSVYSKSFFANCNWDNSQLDMVEIEGSTLCLSKFSNCAQMSMVAIDRTRLFDVIFHNCQISQISIVKGKIRRIVFDECEIESLGLIVDAPIEFFTIKNSVTSKVFIKASTKISDLEIIKTYDKESSWRELYIDRATIENSTLTNSDFSKTHFNVVSIRQTSLQESLFMSSTFERASLNHVDMAESILVALKSIDSVFTKVSFYLAEMSYVDIDNKTIFDSCYMESTNTVPSLR